MERGAAIRVMYSSEVSSLGNGFSSDEDLAFAAVGRDLVDYRPGFDQVEGVEALAELSGLAVSHEDRIADLEPVGYRAE